MTADVTVCIPAYKAADFVSNAIESVLTQSYDNIKVLISVEPTEDGTEAVCRRYEDDPRVTIKVNPQRLGWVGNTNSCLDLVDTPFVCFCFHDDWLEPDFVKDTRQELINDTSAVAAFCHIQEFGNRSECRRFDAYPGTPYERALTYLTKGSSTYSLKSILRSEPFRNGLRMPEIGPRGYRADTPLMLALSLLGTARVVDRVLYRKNFSETTTTTGWRNEAVELVNLWEFQMRAAVMEIIAKADIAPGEKLALARVASAELLCFWGRLDNSEASIDEYETQIAAQTALAQLGVSVPVEETLEDTDRANAFFATQYKQRAASYLQQSDPYGAIVFARKAVAKAPDDSDGLMMLARAHLQLSKLTGANHMERCQELAEAATDADAKDGRAWLLRAQLARRQGHKSDALEFARRALDTTPTGQEKIRRFIETLSAPAGR